MFIGHFGLALATKKSNAAIRLGTAIFAAQFLDLLWPIFVLLGIERFSIEPGNTKLTPLNFESYPYSHSLEGSIVLGLLFGIIFYLVKKKAKAAILYTLLVVSHWVLDYFTHRPDLQLTFTSDEKAGLGLWNYPVAAIVIESIIYFGGAWLYYKSTKAINTKGKVLFWILLLLLVAFHFLNMFGPPPPSVDVVTYSALLLWLFVILGYWIDKNRTTIA